MALRCNITHTYFLYIFSQPGLQWSTLAQYNSDLHKTAVYILLHSIPGFSLPPKRIVCCTVHMFGSGKNKEARSELGMNAQFCPKSGGGNEILHDTTKGSYCVVPHSQLTGVD